MMLLWLIQNGKMAIMKSGWRDRWQEAAVGAFQETGGRLIEAATMFEFGLETTGPVTGTVGQTEMTISKITIKDPRGTGRAKWTLKDRETINQRMATKAQITMDWMQAGREMANEQPTMFRKQIAGQIGCAYLMKCPKIMYQQITIQEEELGEWICGEVIDLPVQKWGR
jgi:hypothetical protein